MADETTGEKIANWVWDRRDEIVRLLQGLRDWFKGSSKDQTPHRGILIIGPGGAGKTTLAKQLAGQFDFLLDSPDAYDESINIERFTLLGQPEVEVVVPPGQKHRREATWGELSTELEAGKFRGLILLSAYGYHTLGRISYKDHKLYRGDKEAFLRAYLAESRTDELSVLRQITTSLLRNREKTWVLSVTTKEDLWWPENADVQRHYLDGDYAAEIQKVLGQWGPGLFRHEHVFASLVISNFDTAREHRERLAQNTAGYDQGQQVQSLRRLLETLDALRRWEGQV
jgi:hypothetical protein